MATALWSGVQAINAEARASYDAAAATLAEGRFDQILPREGEGVAQQRFVDLRARRLAGEPGGGRAPASR